MSKDGASAPVSFTATTRLRLHVGDAIAMGPGKAALLDAIEAAGSISGAARKLEMSYRRAWLLVDEMNRCARDVLVETMPGGKGGGGARVTALGLEWRDRFRAMEQKIAEAIETDLAEFAALTRDPPS